MHHHARGTACGVCERRGVSQTPSQTPSWPGHTRLGRDTDTQAFSSFINRYIFPGGHLPTITQLINHITTASKGTLIVERVENIGGHYAKTLRLWKENFRDRFDREIRPALTKEHPEMTTDEIEVFRRTWMVGDLQAYHAGLDARAVEADLALPASTTSPTARQVS